MRALLLALTASTVSAAATYQNPLLARDFPDPTVTRAADGSFYGYATMGGGCHYQVANSSDMVTWHYIGEAMPSLPWWASASATWAPDVTFHTTGAKGAGYYMYFAAKNAVSGFMCIGVAFSAVPAGPFVDARGTPLLCGSNPSWQFQAIDPKSFDDPVTGLIYLYYGSDFAPLEVVQLDASRTSVAAGPAGSNPVVLLQPDGSFPYESLIEGTWVFYKQPYYYLMYSGDNCCTPNAHYAVMVARSTSPLGPFIRLGAAAGPSARNDSTIITATMTQGLAFGAPGHNSVVLDDAGTPWMYYHAYQLAPGGGVIGGRYLLADPLQWITLPGVDGEWPILAAPGAAPGKAGNPSSTPQTAPVVNLNRKHVR